MTVSDNSEINVAADELRSYIERIERLAEEKKAISDDTKDVYAELSGRGFDAKIVRKIIRLRKRDEADRIEEAHVMQAYLSALGMQGDLFE
ncbi:hypothetical protein D3C87_915620 [compost metagenome]